MTRRLCTGASRRLRRQPGRVALLLVAALALAALVTVAAAPFAHANAGDPDSTHATWHYVSGNSGPIVVTVSGTWSWGTNPSGGKDSQSCAQGKTVSQTNVNGHEAVGIAVDWGDSSSPNALSGKTSTGQPVTIHVGSSMDWINAKFCAGTTASAPYPHGTFNVDHQYASFAAFAADTHNGQLCVNAYDVHRLNNANELNPAKNGDNTLRNGHYQLSVDCAVAQSTNPTPAPTPPTSPAQPAAPAAKPALTLVKVEKFPGDPGFVPGPITGHVGDTVLYRMIVRNTGNTTLEVTLTDAGCNGGTLIPSGSHAVVLAPGQGELYTCSHLLTTSDGKVFVNTATANGHSASATAQTVTATASVKANVQPRAGVLGVKKVKKKATPTRTTVTHRAQFTG
jgi:uncharacterized repeat protein (TIGR01451 family)